MQIRRALLPALLLAAAACGSKPDAAPAGDASTNASTTASAGATATSGSGDDLADVRNYELSMEKVDKLFAAQRNLALKAKAMSPAEREAMQASSDASDPSASLDDVTRKVENTPPMRDAIRDAGLSPREYVLASMAMLQSAMAAGVLKMRPKDDADSLIREMKADPKNVRFMQEHEAEIMQKQQALQAEMKRMGVEQDDH